MRLNHLGKGVVALATTLCLFLALTTPASANPYTVTVTGGTLTAAGNVFTLGPGNPGPCEPPNYTPNPAKPTLQAQFIPDPVWGASPPNHAQTGKIRIFGGFSSEFQLGTPPGGQWYQADFTVLNPANPHFTWTWTNPPAPPPWVYAINPTVPANHPIFQVRINRIGPGSTDDDCAKDDLACIITVRMNLSGTLTSTTPLLPYTAGSVVLNGGSVAPHMAVASCAAPFAAWAGQTATLAGLTLV